MLYVGFGRETPARQFSYNGHSVAETKETQRPPGNMRVAATFFTLNR
jgi:hypothetical protein